jgi:hypothetical protein
MHHLHTLVWLLDRLAEGDAVAWLFLGGTLVLLGIGLAYDLRRNKKHSSTLDGHSLVDEPGAHISAAPTSDRHFGASPKP